MLKRWTPEEDEYLLTHPNETYADRVAIAEHIGRSYKAIKSHIEALRRKNIAVPHGVTHKEICHMRKALEPKHVTKMLRFLSTLCAFADDAHRNGTAPNVNGFMTAYRGMDM